MPDQSTKTAFRSEEAADAHKEVNMPRDLPDHIPGSGHGLGYNIFSEEEIDLTSSYSLASTANDLVLEHGRRYPNFRYASSPFPQGDEVAQQHEIALHNAILFMLHDKLFMSPIEQPRNVLDVKCGKLGLWSRNMAETYPDAQVSGMDVTKPNFRDLENCEFVLQSFGDHPWILDEITQAYGKFDLIYGRHLFAGCTDFPLFFQQCFE